MKAFVAAEGFEQELVEEIGTKNVIATHGRIVVAKDVPSIPVAWAQNVWLAPQEIEVSSITDAARKLKALQPYWALESTRLHRRAQLIQEQLPKMKASPIEFLSPPPSRSFGSWTLLENDRILASPSCTSPYPIGEVIFNPDKSAPSRAYLKLWELFTVYGVRPKAGERCVDFGASPGGWSWVLAKMGCNVVAIDRAELDPKVARLKNVETIQRNAFTLKPEELGPIDWFFSDIICYPAQLFELVEKWRESGLCRNFVCTIKFKGKTDFETTRRFQSIPGSRLQHLYNNKHELTRWLVEADA